ncbi:transposase [Rhodococcus koreensis]
MRLVRKEHPHPGAQLRFTDADVLRLTAFVTNTRRGQLTELELRHHRRARYEDRIQNAKITDLENLPLHGLDQNRIWLAVAQLACELTMRPRCWRYPSIPPAGGNRKRLRLRLRLWSIAPGHPPCPRRAHLKLAARACGSPAHGSPRSFTANIDPW